MIDALLYAVRDVIRAAGINFGVAECEIMDSGRPPPRCGNFFAAVHDGTTRSGPANSRNLDELFDFSVTLTARLGRVSIDRVGDQLIARNLARAPLGNREGFNAKVELLRALLHSNWKITVLTGQTPNSANDNLTAWLGGSGVYGFVEPARYRGLPRIAETPADWFGDDPDSTTLGVKAELRFEGARRFQPQTASLGLFDNMTLAPAAPTNLQAAAGAGQVSLTWTAVSGATSYSVYRGTSSGTETLLASGVATATYLDTSVVAGTTYYYQVTASNVGGESSKSNEASAAAIALWNTQTPLWNSAALNWN